MRTVKLTVNEDGQFVIEYEDALSKQSYVEGRKKSAELATALLAAQKVSPP